MKDVIYIFPLIILEHQLLHYAGRLIDATDAEEENFLMETLEGLKQQLLQYYN